MSINTQIDELVNVHDCSINMSINTQIDELVNVHDRNRYFNKTKEAAKNEDIDAQYKLATYYISERHDVEKALYWCQKAAENGDVNATNRLAAFYHSNRKETKKNPEKAFIGIK